jgi:hypothetical protein
VTEFYFQPNDAHFWHWPTLIHFALVALAGGAAVVTAIAALARHPNARRYALVTMILIVLDLATLWIESPARFRFSHVWLFLAFTPSSPIWLGAWGLIVSLGSSFFLWWGRGPRLLWGGVLVVGSALALIYPGLALALNANRPLWTGALLVLFPLTGMISVVAIAHLLAQGWAGRLLLPLGVASAVVGASYLTGLAIGGAEAQRAFAYLLGHGGGWLIAALAALVVAPLAARRSALLAAGIPLVAATLIRSLILEVGQRQLF